MDEYESLSQSKWECKYYVVFIPKCSRKALCEDLRQRLGTVFRKESVSRILQNRILQLSA